MIDVLAGITDDKLAGATPCAEYTVAGLLGHVDTLSIRLAALARGEDAGPAGDSPRELIGQHVHALAAAWQEPSVWQGTTDVGVTLTNEVWGRIALTEMVVHGWDLATATDQPFDLPEPTLRACPRGRFTRCTNTTDIEETNMSLFRPDASIFPCTSASAVVCGLPRWVSVGPGS
jgi:uncharacterized protein (TIGR03086 family)